MKLCPAQSVMTKFCITLLGHALSPLTCTLYYAMVLYSQLTYFGDVGAEV